MQLQANRYRVTGVQSKTRFYLQANGLPTGFKEHAATFIGPDSAARAAAKENADPQWSLRWTIERFTYQVGTN